MEVICLNYRNYQRARDAAWRILIDCGVDRLPVETVALCGKLGCRLYSYEAGRRLIQAFRLERQAGAADGFTVMHRGVPYVFYNGKTTAGRQRFTVAHELGHIVLGHLGESEHSTRNREPAQDDAPEETQANQFAARLLAPACVLHALQALTPKEISALCGISMQAACFRAERMCELEARGRFLQHPLEREVMAQFEAFVRSHLASI